MEKGSARLFQQGLATSEHNWNIVELATHRHLRQRVNELIQLVNHSSLTTDEIHEQLLASVTTFGDKFAAQLVRSLYRDNLQERQAVVWLLTVLKDEESIPSLQRISRDRRISRAIRLSASLALAGMGATRETQETDEQRPRRRLYAIS